MASEGTRALTLALILAWISVTLVAQDIDCMQNIACMIVKDPDSQTDFYHVSFNMSMFQRFHSCLCNGSAADCVAQLDSVHKNVVNVNDEGRVVDDQISRTYNCTAHNSTSKVICKQLSLQNLTDITSKNVKSFHISWPPCDSTCIVFSWQSEEERMNYNQTVGATDCGTRSTTTEKAITTTAEITPLTTTTTIITATKEIPKTTKPTTSMSNHGSSPTTAANLGNKTSDKDTPAGVIVGVVIGVIVVVSATVIGVIIWRQRRAALRLSKKMDNQMDIPKKSSEARNQGLESKINMDDTSNTQLQSTDNSYLEGETYAVPHKTKHQQDAIPTDISKNGTKSAISILNQQCAAEKNAPDHDYARANSVPAKRSDLVKSDNSTFTKEDVNGNKSTQPKSNIVEDDFGYAFAEEPPDQEKSQNLNFNTALFYQPTGFDKGGSFGDDYGYGGVYDVDVAGDGDGGTRNNDDNKGKTIPSDTSVSNVKNSDRSSGTGDYGYSYIDQEFSNGSRATPATGVVNASVGRNSEFEYPVMENDYDFVSVNGNTQTNNNPCIMDTNIDDDYSTIGNECHSRKPTSDTGSNSKNVYAKLHEEKRDMHNPYNSLLSPKEDPEVRKPMALPSQKNLPTNQSARYSIAQTSPNPFSNHGSDETIPVIDLAPSTNSLPMTNTHGANGDQNNSVYRIKPFDGDDEYAVVCKKKS